MRFIPKKERVPADIRSDFVKSQEYMALAFIY